MQWTLEKYLPLKRRSLISLYCRERCKAWKFSELSKRWENFVIFASRTYLHGRNPEYNIMAATNLADPPRLGPAIKIVRRRKQLKAYTQRLLPVELVVGIEISFTINAFEENKNILVSKNFLTSEVIAAPKHP